MYVYVSENCRKEAKIFGLEAKIDKIAKQIERLDYHGFTTQVEKFEHPFYVKKQVAYNYRLLVKVVDLDIEGKHHQVAVLFKIFNRSNKGYDDFYYHVERQGNILYNQQNIDGKLHHYIKNISQKKDIKNTKVMNQDDCFGYFLQIKTDLLQLSGLIASDQYYQEDSTWYYGLRPYLSDEELQKVFAMIQDSLERIKSGQLLLSDGNVFFDIETFRLSAFGHKGSDYFRILPQEVLDDKWRWQKLQALSLPIYFNHFQQHILNVLFTQKESFPLIVNTPSNHGKTSLSAILAIHFLSQANWQNHGVLPCLLLCSANHKETIKQQMMHYVSYYHQYINPDLTMSVSELKDLIEACCHDMTSYIYQHGDEAYEQFNFDKVIDFDKFSELWQSSSLPLKNQYSHYPVSLIWYVIYHLIKGKQGVIDINKDLLPYHLSDEDYSLIYQHIYKGWYELLQKEGFWDLQDLVAYANQKNHHRNYASLIIDDAQEYTKLDMMFLLKQCYWHHHKDFINQAPLLFFGSDDGKSYYYQNWHQTLTAHLHEMLDNIKEGAVLQPTVIEYQPDFLNPLRSSINVWRQKLALSQTALLDNTDILKQNQKVYFVDIDNHQMLHALFGKKNIPIIIRKSRQTAEWYLMNDASTGRIFKYTTPSEGDIQFLALEDVAQKYQHSALFGFFDDDLSLLCQEGQINAWDLLQKIHVDDVLKDIQEVLNNTLSDVFIVGKSFEYETWQTLFGDNEQSFIQKATIDDINPNFIYHQQESYAVNKESSQEALFKKAEWLFNHAYYEPCMKTLMSIAHHHNKDYNRYFEFAHSEGQKAFTLYHLWKYKSKTALFSYVNYFKDNLPKDFIGNCYLIQLLSYEGINIPKTQAFNSIFAKYALQYYDADWSEYWHILLDDFMGRLADFHLTEQESNSLVNHLLKLLPKKTPHIHHYLAEYYYQIGDNSQAFDYWRLSKAHQELQEMPMAYYKLVPEYVNDWQEKLLAYIELDDLGATMSTLSTHDLNELQLSYWDKILPYLDDVEELQTVILALLPDIHNPDILQRIYDYCTDEEDVSGEFENRLQRLLTVQACFEGNWQYIKSRIDFYKPADMSEMMDKLSQAFSVQKNNSARQIKGSSGIQRLALPFDKPQNELVDIIYALCLNDQLISYQEDVKHEYHEDIKAVFESIKNIFSKQINNEIRWNVDFPAVRALACLMEKSMEPSDMIALYCSMINFAKHHKEFALMRLWNFTQMADSEEGKFIQESEEYQQMQKQYAEVKPAINKLTVKAETQGVMAPLKTKEEVVKSVLALNDKENKEIQRLKSLAHEHQKQEERKQKERLEQERQAQLEQERQEKLKQERLEQERREQERLEQERQAQIEKERLEQIEKERLEKERQEKLEQERQEQERQAQIEKERQEQERLAQEKLAQEQLEKERQALTQSPEQTPVRAPQTHDTPAQPTYTQRTKVVQMVSVFEFFEWRIFVARLYGRVNVESLVTGERFSVQIDGELVQSDWDYTKEGDSYALAVPLAIHVVGNMVFIDHLEHGVSLTIRI